jgi:hypothetical protein
MDKCEAPSQCEAHTLQYWSESTMWFCSSTVLPGCRRFSALIKVPLVCWQTSCFGGQMPTTRVLPPSSSSLSRHLCYCSAVGSGMILLTSPAWAVISLPCTSEQGATSLSE